MLKTERWQGSNLCGQIGKSCSGQARPPCCDAVRRASPPALVSQVINMVPSPGTDRRLVGRGLEQSMTNPQLRSLAIAAVACLSFAASSGLAAGGAVKDCILVNHVGFVPRSAKYCVVVNPPAKRVLRGAGLGRQGRVAGSTPTRPCGTRRRLGGRFQFRARRGTIHHSLRRVVLAASRHFPRHARAAAAGAFQLFPHSAVRRQPHRLAHPLPS